MTVEGWGLGPAKAQTKPTSQPFQAYAPDGMPSIAWQKYGETRSFGALSDGTWGVHPEHSGPTPQNDTPPGDVAVLNATGDINTTLPDYKVLELRRAYYSAISYTGSFFSPFV